MTILAFPSTRRQPVAFGIRLAARRLWDSGVRAWRTRQATRAMAELSDGMLHDIGVTRGQIEHVVRYGRVPPG